MRAHQRALQLRAHLGRDVPGGERPEPGRDAVRRSGGSGELLDDRARRARWRPAPRRPARPALPRGRPRRPRRRTAGRHPPRRWSGRSPESWSGSTYSCDDSTSRAGPRATPAADRVVSDPRHWRRPRHPTGGTMRRRSRSRAAARRRPGRPPAARRRWRRTRRRPTAQPPRRRSSRPMSRLRRRRRRRPARATPTAQATPSITVPALPKPRDLGPRASAATSAGRSARRAWASRRSGPRVCRCPTPRRASSSSG